MFTVTDTHRLSYRNAQLRAYALTDNQRTTPLNFYNINTDDDDDESTEPIGTIVYTDERGYICYGTDKQKVQCLALKENAIIECSLDNGRSWLISWIVYDDGDLYVKKADLRSLTWQVSEDETDSYDTTEEKTLPDFIRRDELDIDNIWQEDTIVVESADVSASGIIHITITEWTKIIYIGPDISSIGLTIHVDNTTPRAGQSFTIINNTNDILSMGAYEDFTIKAKSKKTLYYKEDSGIFRIAYWPEVEPVEPVEPYVFDIGSGYYEYESRNYYIYNINKFLSDNRSETPQDYEIWYIRINPNQWDQWTHNHINDIDLYTSASHFPVKKFILCIEFTETLKIPGDSAGRVKLWWRQSKSDRHLLYDFGDVDDINHGIVYRHLLWYIDDGLYDLGKVSTI